MSKFESLKLENQLCFALYSATNIITRIYCELLEKHDLTYPQYLALVVLWKADGIAVKSLSEQLKLDSGTLSPLLKRLENKGLIQRSRSEKDERVVLLHLTQEAINLEPQIAKLQNEVATVTGLNNDDFHDLLGKLHHLAETMDNNLKTLKKVS